MLYGREREQERLRELLDAARDGSGGVLVVRGGPGIGKTALLDWAAGLDAALVLRGGGVEFEADLPFAGLSLLLRPVLGHLERLPAPQRAALAGAFGLGPAAAADRLLVGFGVLSLLAEAAGDGPVLCLVDDAQWLDSVSADALLFAARRLGGEGVALVLAARDGEFAAPGLAELRLSGLADADAARLIEDGLDPGVRHRILAEAQGNPLALIELPRVAGDEPAAAGGLSERLLAAFRGQVDGLAEATRAVLLVAAAEDTGDLGVVLRAAGAQVGDLRPAEQARLVEVSAAALRFRHPWCAPPCTTVRRSRSGSRCTSRSPPRCRGPRPPTGAPGTGPRPPPGPTTTSPRPSRAPPGRPASAAATARPRPPTSAPHS
ncbi:AAA family ATPase [Dactylosporangium darangshiense]|uniref:AAA family ATPase n=1 Tax=Dactylosporangium darangshiense TaxID=579108 RepID=UPI003642D6D2